MAVEGKAVVAEVRVPVEGKEAKVVTAVVVDQAPVQAAKVCLMVVVAMERKEVVAVEGKEAVGGGSSGRRSRTGSSSYSMSNGGGGGYMKAPSGGGALISRVVFESNRKDTSFNSMPRESSTEE
uniref:Uncharacterized protein n=1 Tax=Nelumbo nucifera TaxID=4432 RepID=A0A822YZS5_NELNU|nr:TPA_asm: hypothetical protein HUJ06_007410 [Nelumbo nucifera]